MSKFPGKHNYKDVIKFKMRGRGIVEGYIVGIVVSCGGTENEYVQYKVHSVDGITPSFFFKDVKESEIIED